MLYRKDSIKKLIGFSPDEWSVVCQKSKAAKHRTETYIRRMAVKGEVKIYELKELSALKRAFLFQSETMSIRSQKAQILPVRFIKRKLRTCRKSLDISKA